ncbi:hypothetical protein BD769DRAFT_1366791 [Suillus cothurnatus]|nr:hypothetical protein BD769DRAFT_1366791 [Suillus cothurnatus]
MCALERYIAVMLQSNKSPYRGTVAADITGAILKKHAEHGQPAQYWDRAEQERRLMVAFDKWVDKGIWSAAAQKVHQEQLKHVRKGCLERSIQGIRSDGSRIEGSHKGWNSLQRAQPSGVAMLTALAHNFVLRRNVRVAFSRSVVTPFIEFTHGSHHLRLCDYVARLHNTLQQDYMGSQLQVLPELHDVDSGETFGLVVSDHIATFGGFLVKEENVEKGLLDSFEPSVDSETGEDVDLAFLASRNVIINEWQIDPALLTLPAKTSRPMVSNVTHFHSTFLRILIFRFDKAPSAVSLDSDDDEVDASNAVKKLRTLALPSSSEVPTMGPGAGLLDAYFPSVRDVKSSKEVCSSTYLWYILKLSSLAGSLTGHALASTIRSSLPINDTRYVNSPLINATTRKLPPPEFLQDHPVCSSAGVNNSVTVAAGQTRSQRLFSISTGIDPRSLTFQSSDEFYMFMDMQAEFKWLSYQMTSKRWVLATEEYNRRLMKKNGQSVVPKNPQALLRALGDIEPKLMSKITKNDYTSRRNSESFWRRHCSVVSLVKEESGKKARKAQTCSRCQTIMYPGPENSPLNHKKGYCADGVKQSSKTAGEELPPWPQPRGIFSEGRTFHPHVFLSTVQRVYEHVFMQGPGETDLLETEAFSKLLISRTNVHESDNMVLFRLFKGFITDPTTPRDRIVSHDGEEWLRINYLQQ